MNLRERDKSMRTLDVITSILLIIGGLNWLLIGVTGRFDAVMASLGRVTPYLAYAVYVLVGLSAIYQAIFWKAIREEYWLAHRTRTLPGEPPPARPAVQP